MLGRSRVGELREIRLRRTPANQHTHFQSRTGHGPENTEEGSKMNRVISATARLRRLRCLLLRGLPEADDLR